MNSTFSIAAYRVKINKQRKCVKLRIEMDFHLESNMESKRVHIEL